MNILNYLLIIICLLLLLVSNSFACSDTYPCTSPSTFCTLSQAQASCRIAQADGCKPLYVSVATCMLNVIQCHEAADGSAIADVAYQVCGDTDGDWPCFGGYSPVNFWARLYHSDAQAEPFSCSSSAVDSGSNSSGSSNTCNLDTADSTKWISTPPNSGGGGTKTCSDSCLYIASGACYTDGRCEYRLGNPITDSVDFAACASYSSVTNNNNTTVNIDLSGVESRLDDLGNTAGQIGRTVTTSVDKLTNTAGQIGKSLNDFMNPDTSELPAKSTELQTEVTTSLSSSTTSQSDLDSSLSDLNGNSKFSQSDLFIKFSNQLIEPFANFHVSGVCPLKENFEVSVAFFGSDLDLNFDLSALCLWFSIIRIFILIGFFFKALRIAFL